MAKQPKQTQAEKVETQEEYRQRIMSLVCSLMIEGRDLEQICHSGIEGVPKRTGTIREWCAEDKELAAMYARARELMADELLERLAVRNQELIREYLSEGWEPKDAISASKAIIDSEKWRMQRMFPKKCGDKIEQTLQNPDGSALAVTVKIEI
jgi:hypothetical protein